MSCEDIGEPEFSSELAIDYLRSVLPEPRGCRLEPDAVMHTLATYPVIRLCADPSFGCDGPPMEYVCAYQDLLDLFEQAVDWPLITHLLAAEAEGGGADQYIPPHGPAPIRTSDVPDGELEPEWRRSLQRFPDAVDWEKIEPSGVAELIRRHLEPEIEEGGVEEEDLCLRFVTFACGFSDINQRREFLSKNRDLLTDQSIRWIQEYVSRSTQGKNATTRFRLFRNLLIDLTKGPADEVWSDYQLPSDSAIFALNQFLRSESWVDVFTNLPAAVRCISRADSRRLWNYHRARFEDNRQRLDLLRAALHDLRPLLSDGLTTERNPDSSKKIATIDGVKPVDEYLKEQDQRLSEEWIPNLPPFPAPDNTDSSQKDETVRINGMPLDEYLKRSDRLMSDHPEPSHRPFPKQAKSEKE